MISFIIMRGPYVKNNNNGKKLIIKMRKASGQIKMRSGGVSEGCGLFVWGAGFCQIFGLIHFRIQVERSYLFGLFEN